MGLWLSFGGVGLGFIFGVGWWFKGQFTKFWPVTDPATLVFVDPHVGSQTGPWVAQLQPETQTIIWQSLPANQETELLNGYGLYKLAAVYPLLQIDHRSQNHVRATFSLITGAIVDEVVPWSELPKWQAQLQPETLTKFGSIPIREVEKLYWQRIWYKDLKFSERVKNFSAWKLAWRWRWFADQTQFHWQSDLISTAGPLANQCAVAVVNATGIKGLARQLSQVLAADGYSVVRVSAELAGAEQTHLWLDPASQATCESVAEKLRGVLAVPVVIESNTLETSTYRAPIVILVGNDSSR